MKQKTMITGSVLGIIAAIVLFVYDYVDVQRKQREQQEWKEQIEEKAASLFEEAVYLEEDITIKTVMSDHDSRFMDKEVTWNEKDRWIKQYYIYSKDSIRENLDSLYQDLVSQEGLPVITHVSCTVKGKKCLPKRPWKISEAVALPAICFSIDRDTTNNIVLQPYLWYLDQEEPIGSRAYIGGLVLLAGLSLAWIVYILKRKQLEQKILEPEPVSEVQESTVQQIAEKVYVEKPICVLTDVNLYKRARVVKRGKQDVELTPMEVQYMELFAWDKKHEITHLRICQQIYNTHYEHSHEITRMEHQRINATVSRLRSKLGSLNLTILVLEKGKMKLGVLK